MDSHIAVVTETWLWDGPELEDDVDDLLHGADDLHASEVLELTLHGQTPTSGDIYEDNRQPSDNRDGVPGGIARKRERTPS